MAAARRLTADEAALWAALAGTVQPLKTGGPGAKRAVPPKPLEVTPGIGPAVLERPAVLIAKPAASRPLGRPLDRGGLDAGWERRLARGGLGPDLTLDLHGATLAEAHARLEAGVGQALACGARVLLLVTGKPRAEAAGEGGARGAIRARFLDWLSVGPHAGAILAVRAAHPRHGGAGAVYIVLRRLG